MKLPIPFRRIELFERLNVRSVGRNESLLIKVATARLRSLRGGWPLIGYLFETGQDSGWPHGTNGTGQR
jgi:hypothetical protein